MKKFNNQPQKPAETDEQLLIQHFAKDKRHELIELITPTKSLVFFLVLKMYNKYNTKGEQK